MNNTRKLRPFRRVLLSLIVAEVIGGCWLGSQIRWARDREAFMTRTWVTDITAPGAKRPRPPGVLRMLGAKGVRHLCVTTKAEMPEAQRLFPEAQISQHVIFTVPMLR